VLTANNSNPVQATKASTSRRRYRANDHAMISQDDGYVLSVGNSYEHKFLKSSCAHISSGSTRYRLVVLGLQVEDDDRILTYQGGEFDNEAIADLYACEPRDVSYAL
jgi:hypothetical protein